MADLVLVALGGVQRFLGVRGTTNKIAFLSRDGDGPKLAKAVARAVSRGIGGGEAGVPGRGADAGDAGRVVGEPAEYHNPVPVRFLAVERTPFQAWLIGQPEDIAPFGELLCDGVDDLGLGGKTAAGYGYCKAVLQP